MALTRKFLTALGIEADKVDEIIEAHAETVNGLKAERDEARSSADELERVKAELAEAKKTLDGHDKDPYKVKYEAIREEFDQYKADQEATATKAEKSRLYRQLLKDAGISEKRIDAIMKVTSLEEIEIDGDHLKDADKLTESVKTEWADFVTTTTQEGAGTQTPPPEEGHDDKPRAIPTII